MEQIKERGHPETPPAIATDGNDAYRAAMVETWGKVPEPKPSGKGLPPEKKQPQLGWHYLQVVKHREGGRVVEVNVEVIYGDETTLNLVGAQTSYVERTNLTSRQMNGRLVRKTLSFSKELEMLEASSVWEDAVYNLTREVKTLRVEVGEPESDEIRLDQIKFEFDGIAPLDQIKCDFNGIVPLDQFEVDGLAPLDQLEFDRVKLDEVESDQPSFNKIEIGEIDLAGVEPNQPEPNQVEGNQTKIEEVEIKKRKRRYQRRSPAMASGLTDHIWTIKELLMTVVPPTQSTRDG